MKWKVYAYANCGTCRNALKYLKTRGVRFEVVPIREQPPSRAELRRMLAIYGGKVRKLFNTSGQDYRQLKLGERLMSEDEALDLLSRNGNLVKRPFVLTETGGIVGFKEAEWDKLVS